MNRLTNNFMMTAVATATLLFAGTVGAFAQAGGSAPAAQATSTKAAKVKAPAAPAPTAAEIADATSKGLVWVNLNTKVYHKSGVPTYGTTKNGKFMTEADAKTAGFKAAQEPKAKKAAAAAAPKQ